MRQAGVLAAAGLIALEEGPARLHEDHANARLLAEALANMDGVEIEPGCGGDEYRGLQVDGRNEARRSWLSG